jgi:non-specific serine/threonine protein kinase
MLIAGRFRLMRRLGHGTFADVWVAEDEQIASGAREVAIKIFRPLARDDGAIPWEPVRREIVAGARMTPHKGVLRPRALLRARLYADGQDAPCLLFDYVEGMNLACWLLRTGHPGPGNVLVRIRVLSNLLEAIAHVHGCGIAHRDISFGNVLVRSGAIPSALLADFGSCQFDDTPVDERADLRCQELQPINHPPYSALLPLWKSFGRDVYAFAVLCYLTLIGRHPLADDWQSMRAGRWTGRDDPHGSLARRPLGELAPWVTDLSQGGVLSDLLLGCLHPDISKRPTSRAAWERWRDLFPGST